jgi:hypothetical protein
MTDYDQMIACVLPRTLPPRNSNLIALPNMSCDIACTCVAFQATDLKIKIKTSKTFKTPKIQDQVHAYAYTPLQGPTTTLPSGFTASLPSDDSCWRMSCRYLHLDQGIHNTSSAIASCKVICDTGTSEVITSDPTDFCNGYTAPTTPLRLRGVSSGAMVEGTGMVK